MKTPLNYLMGADAPIPPSRQMPLQSKNPTDSSPPRGSDKPLGPRGGFRGGFNEGLLRKPTLPRRGLKNLMVLLVLHSCRMKHPVEDLKRGAPSISSIYRIFMVRVRTLCSCSFLRSQKNNRSLIRTIPVPPLPGQQANARPGAGVLFTVGKGPVSLCRPGPCTRARLSAPG